MRHLSHFLDQFLYKRSGSIKSIVGGRVFESGGSTTKLDGISDGGGQQKQQAWAVIGGGEGIAERFHELVPDMALDFPFELDKFQKEAIYYLERGESVFVAAHTSAGKTVVAEYAFALASKHCTRAVYTAPIKTISNQKYRDFCGKFDVGLLTGDVSLRPEASCLIMTTEILRSMLYRGADIIRDIEWVIFDEVHYVNDVERGVVWEEVIIMLPRHINFVLLSATVWHRRTFQPSGLFAARVDLQGSTPWLHALFTGEDDTWEAWLNVDASGFSGVMGFSGSGIKIRRGYSPSHSPKPTQDELRQQKEEEMDDYCSQVVFDTLRKFDGKEFRQLLPGEYTQMAGRAGRRGLDKIGTVVVMCRDEILEESDLKHVIVGSATRLESQFRLTYIMILHLLRVEELKVEDMLKRSFAEFHAQKKLPEQQKLLILKLAQPTKTSNSTKAPGTGRTGTVW
ncbi:hypothetical protein CMV_022995 [Castanea mollissima]|uniref:Helicase ATP-binding domain-containing protein n=1 Tax=Castanea mollissima TaxID=60419 RepID=A0A8J4V7E7_9ROSI|nr:hypothetical protein CMV_022995 [Castanea mollissima]